MSANLMIEYFFIFGFVTEFVWSYDFVTISNASIMSRYIIKYVLCDVSMVQEYLQIP